MRRAALTLAVATAAAAAAAAANANAAEPSAPPLFFDDFSHADTPALRSFGWQLRSAPGHPGVPGASWRPDALTLRDDPAQPGNRLLRLTARTDGTPAGTVQAQLCHERKALFGTYAARVRFTDEPVSGASGDPVIQTFYAVAPLHFDFDPEFSEIDWEYLPSGGWGSAQARLYAIAWQTVRIEPWQAYNAAQEVPARWGGWRTLTVQVESPAQGGRSRWFVDGREVALHAGRNHPVVPMAISFNLWFSPSGLLPASSAPRVWVQDVDWVLHAPDRLLAPEAVAAEVVRLRAAGVAQIDTVSRPQPALADRCNF